MVGEDEAGVGCIVVLATDKYNCKQRRIAVAHKGKQGYCRRHVGVFLVIIITPETAGRIGGLSLIFGYAGRL